MSCPPCPHLPELPARGPGADLIGRTGGLLVELPVELYAARWRIAPRPGRDLRRARDLMERDLDQLAEQAEEYAGPVKVQAAGPFTLAAALELPIGGRLLRDPGAVRDLDRLARRGAARARRGGPPPAAPRLGAAPARRAVPAGGAGRSGAHRERLRHPPGRSSPRWPARCCTTVVEAAGVPTRGALLRPGRAAGADPYRRGRRRRAGPRPGHRPRPARRGDRRRARAAGRRRAARCRRPPVARRPRPRSPTGYASSGTGSASPAASSPSRWWSPRPAASPVPPRSTPARCSPPAGTPAGGCPRSEVFRRTWRAG